MSYRMRYTQSRVPGLSRAVRLIILINMILYIVQHFAPDGYLRIFGLVPAFVLGRGFIWQLVTYMFLHGSLLHIFFNMLFLWMMGSELERYWGSREFVKYYLVTGAGAGVINVLVQPNSAVPIIGASGAVFGLIIAFGMAFPDRELLLYFFIRIKAKHFAVLIGLIELISLFALPNAGIARFAHLGGLLVGYFYLKWERITYPFKRWYMRSRGKMEDTARRKEEEKEQKIQAEVDRILDKISREGLDSLSNRERDFLQEQSGKRS
jgi:membrane associated rhomboid family serine protease